MDGLMDTDKDEKKASGHDLIRLGREAFERCRDAEDHNRITALADVRFSKLGEQWPAEIKKQREKEKKPCLTLNKMQTFIRQVVNDARMNKPSIKVRPADSNADPKVADIMGGLIRNIEYSSNADIAYDTAVDTSVTGGFGYIRVGLDYAFDDTFDMDVTIERVLNPFSVYGDPNATCADGSSWNVAFVTDRIPKAEFERKYKDKAEVDFDGDAWSEVNEEWLNEDGVLVAEWWTREEIEKEIIQLEDGRVFEVDQLETDPDLAEVKIGIEMGMIPIAEDAKGNERRRKAKSYKVKQVIMSGVDVLEENDHPGKYIPIVPVYGDEFTVQGKRFFRSLINPAKDAQRMVNYWRTTSTELVALAPRTPWVGPKGSFSTDAERWSTSNTASHPYLEYDPVQGAPPPQRQSLDSGPAAGALQEALNASDDIKSIIGMYDASLGARSNETSGVAINARQREGDVSTFHFIDNLNRAIRHVGRIVIDLIPHVYDSARIIRVIGEDGKEKSVPVNQETQQFDEDDNPMMDEETGDAILGIHDLTVGKYDLTSEAGPSFTTRREESAAQMTELIRAYPPAAPILADLMAKNFDWPGADEVARRFEKMNPTNQQQIPPEIQQQIQQRMQQIEMLTKANEELKASIEIDAEKNRISQYDADTKRIKVEGDLGMNVMDNIARSDQQQQQQMLKEQQQRWQQHQRMQQGGGSQ